MYREDERVQRDWVVFLEYTLRYEDSEELVAASAEEGYLAFIQGHDHVFPVIEGAAEGMRVGDEIELVMPPKETYGEYDPDAMEILPLDSFPDEIEVSVGLEVELFDDESGAEIEAIVVEINDEGVVVDLNHPLAGETLVMWFRVAELRPATEEELAHDHVHESDEEH